MNIGVTEVSPRAIQREAEKNFKKGYYCCEALMATIRNEFKLDVPTDSPHAFRKNAAFIF